MHEKTCSPHLNNVLTLPCENETSYFVLLYPLHQAWCETKFIKYRENKLIVTWYVQNVHHLHELKHASMLAIGQLCHQSATAVNLTTHAADAVAAHQYHHLS